MFVNPRHKLPHLHPVPVHRGGGAPLSRIPHVDHRNQLIPFRAGEDARKAGGIEGPNPEGRQALVLGGEHQVCCNNSGIDLGAVMVVVAADPGIGRTAADDQEERRAVVGARDALDGLQRAGVGDSPYMDGLLVHGRGRDAAGLQDAVDLLLLHRPRRERPAGVSVLDDGIEFHTKCRNIFTKKSKECLLITLPDDFELKIIDLETLCKAYGYPHIGIDVIPHL